MGCLLTRACGLLSAVQMLIDHVLQLIGKLERRKRTLEGGCHANHLVPNNLPFPNNLHVYFVFLISTLTFIYLS